MYSYTRTVNVDIMVKGRFYSQIRHKYIPPLNEDDIHREIERRFPTLKYNNRADVEIVIGAERIL